MALSLNGSSGISGVDGSAGTPALQGTDSNTGISFGTDQVNINTAGSTRATVDSSGRLLVGTSSSITSAGTSGGGAGSTPALQVVHPYQNINPAGISLSRFQAGNPYGAVFTIQKSRNDTIGSHTVVASGDELGVISFDGSNGTAFNTAATISAAVDGTPGTNDMPGRLVFSTTADGASSPTERMRITSAGALQVQGVYDTTTTSGANVNVHTDGTIRRSTSSLKYKANVETLENQYADAVLNCRPVWYQSTCQTDKPEWGHWGFIAEEVAEIDPRLCFFKEEENGTLEVEGVQYDRFVPHLLNLIKRQKEQIEAMEARLTALEGN